jgi:raffinose/stachyose/melibiose transport system permease protein
MVERLFLKQIKETTLYAFLIFLAFLQIFPLLWVTNYSLSKSGDLFGPIFFKIPDPPQWNNYVRSWVDGKIPQYLWNSVIVVSVSVVATTFFAFLISYACMRMEWTGRKWIYGLVLAGMMVPIHTTLLPNFIWFKKLGLIDTHLGLILPYIAFNISFSTLIFSGIVVNIPRSIEEAAYIDGAGLPTILTKVIAPMCTPGFITVGIMTFFSCWNEFIMANTYLAKEELRTIPFSVIRFEGQYRSDYAIQFACLVLVAIPPLILYFLGSKWIVAGVTAGAVKD